MLEAGGRNCSSVCVKWAGDYDFKKENKGYLVYLLTKPVCWFICNSVIFIFETL